jgi:hypothetical protein
LTTHVPPFVRIVHDAGQPLRAQIFDEAVHAERSVDTKPVVRPFDLMSREFRGPLLM